MHGRTYISQMYDEHVYLSILLQMAAHPVRERAMGGCTHLSCYKSRIPSVPISQLIEVGRALTILQENFVVSIRYVIPSLL